MNTNNNNQENQDVDLLFIWKSIIGLINQLGILVVRFIQFLIKHILTIAILIIVGGVLGYLIDSSRSDIYEHDIILSANFNSNAYLYEKIESQQNEMDSMIIALDVKPIVNVFELLTSNSKSLEIGEFLSENNVNISEHKPGNLTEDIYRYHKLTIKTDRLDKDGTIINNYLKDLNQEPYFIKRQKIELEENLTEIIEKQISIDNINKMFEKLGTSNLGNQSTLNIKMFPELQGLVYSKNSLLNDIRNLKISQEEMSKTLYDISIIRNVKVNKFPLMILFPMLFFIFFLLFKLSQNRYKKFRSRIL